MASPDVESHLWLVRSHARQFARRYRPYVELDDLIAEGTIGLLRAAKRFDPTRGVLFRTFAQHVVRGAMLNYVRAQTPMSRYVMAQVRMGLLPPIRLEPLAFDTRADSAPSPDDEVRLRGESTRLHAALAQLSSRERAIVLARHVDDRLYPDIARDWRVTRMRISQIDHEALRTLRTALEA